MNLMCLLLVMVMIMIVSAAAPVLANDEQDCFQGQEPELRIKGCSEIIQRAPNDATAYHNRAVAYGLTGDIDNSIADYTKVIEIAPSNASAYDNRGRAYASKGDYTRAVEDEIKAHALMAKATAQPIVVTPKARKPTKVTSERSEDHEIPTEGKGGAEGEQKRRQRSIRKQLVVVSQSLEQQC